MSSLGLNLALLQAYSPQQVYTTGNTNPFDPIYDQYTNFAVLRSPQQIETGVANWGQTVTFPILRKSHMLTDLKFEINLNYPIYVESYRLGLQIIESYELRSANTVIDMHLTEILDMWYQVNLTPDQYAKFEYEVSGHVVNMNGGAKIIVPTLLFFMRAPGMGIPLEKLNRDNSLEVYVTFSRGFFLGLQPSGQHVFDPNYYKTHAPQNRRIDLGQYANGPEPVPEIDADAASRRYGVSVKRCPVTTREIFVIGVQNLGPNVRDDTYDPADDVFGRIIVEGGVVTSIERAWVGDAPANVGGLHRILLDNTEGNWVEFAVQHCDINIVSFTPWCTYTMLAAPERIFKATHDYKVLIERFQRLYNAPTKDKNEIELDRNGLLKDLYISVSDALAIDQTTPRVPFSYFTDNLNTFDTLRTITLRENGQIVLDAYPAYDFRHRTLDVFLGGGNQSALIPPASLTVQQRKERYAGQGGFYVMSWSQKQDLQPTGGLCLPALSDFAIIVQYQDQPGFVAPVDKYTADTVTVSQGTQNQVAVNIIPRIKLDAVIYDLVSIENGVLCRFFN